jgi:hypothetical protein
MVVSFLGLSIVQQPTANEPTARPGAPRLGWPSGCPTAPPMACPRHVAPPHPAVLAHVSRGASRFSCAGPARGGAHVGKAVPCSLGGPREAVSGCLREAAGATSHPHLDDKKDYKPVTKDYKPTRTPCLCPHSVYNDTLASRDNTITDVAMARRDSAKLHKTTHYTRNGKL